MTIEEVAEQTKDLGMQMQPIELFEIARQIKPPVKMLVFGLGNDSIFWHKTNKGGRTVFLEDLAKWINEIAEKHPELEVYKVNYDTKREDWRQLIDKPELLELDIPEDIKKEKWDLIIVDGPMGFKNGNPGRMKSIYMASKLVKEGGDIFVHDVLREVEQEYCKRFLREENRVSQVNGFSVLNHYKIPK